MKNRVGVGRGVLLAIVLLLVAGSLWAAPYVILKNGQRREGVEIRRMSSGAIVLMLEGGDQITFSADQVARAVADKPPVFDRAVQAIGAGQYENAIKALEKIVEDYHGLEWDIRAMPYLAKAYSENKEYLKAERAFERLFQQNPELERNASLNIAYCDVLVKANKTAKLEKKLDSMIKSGERVGAAHAQVMRGNMAMSAENYKAAAKDYLRTVYFFQNIDAVMPEATFRLAEALEKLRDKRAAEWYAEVVKSYPGSEYAAKARSKL